MARYTLVCLLAALCVADARCAGPAAGSSYKRQRDADRPPNRPPATPGRQQPATVQAGTYQRPYPFHLDYYKQRYGGSYDPYFGNLYGPPNVVLGVPFAFGVTAGGASSAFPGPVQAAPGGGHTIICPHCNQPIFIAAPGIAAPQ